jgi:hypothetical protein
MRSAHILVSALVLLVGGCASLNSIHRTSGFDPKGGADILTVDAKQRHVLITRETDSEKTNKFRICAEAAPDVFSAYASSLGLDVGIGATDRNAKVANSIAEAAATIERTQTVNLLRESMYRTCERYLSGALDADQFIIQAARDQRSMVAVLAIEQLTGVVRTKSTIISGPSTSASVIDGAQAAELIEQFRAEEVTAKANLVNAEKAHSSALKTGKCDTVAEKPAADAKDPTADEWTSCKAAETVVSQRKLELKGISTRLDNALALAAEFVSKSNASTAAGTNESGAGSPSRPGDAALIAVADAVEKIVSTPGINEPLMFCIAYMQRVKVLLNEQIVRTCSVIISDQAEEDIAKQQILRGVANMSDYHAAAAKGSRLNIFVRLLKYNVRATTDDQLSKKVAAFEARAGKSLGLGKACTTRDACLSAIDASDIHDEFLLDEAKWESALNGWDKP